MGTVAVGKKDKEHIFNPKKERKKENGDSERSNGYRRQPLGCGCIRLVHHQA